MNQARNRQIIISVLALLLTTGLVITAQAQGPGHQRGLAGRGGPGQRGEFERGPEMRLERMAQHLDLTAEQTQSIAELFDAGQAETQAMHKQIMRLRNEKRGEMLKDAPATKAVLALTKKIGDLRTDLQTRRMATRLAVRKLLTPAQRNQMLLSGERHGRRGGPFPGGDCDNNGPQRRGGPGHRNR